MTRITSLLGQMSLTVFIATLSLVMLTIPVAGQAQTTNITPTPGSAGLGTNVLPPAAGITSIVGGTTKGSNLFHSFANFSIGVNDTARFATDSGQVNNTIGNIISRVTGTNPSNLFGTLDTKSNFPTANFFLVNPNGIVFGPTATLNVGGSFTATTADYLKMTDGAKFYANPAQSTVLSIAPVAAFGFLSNTPAPITVQRNSVLEVPTGQTLSIIGGDISITGGPLGFLTASSGRINLASVASQGEVIPNLPGTPPSLDTSTFTRLGQIALTDQAVLNTSGNSGGMVVLRGSRLTVDNSIILANTLGNQNGALIAVDINVADSVVMTNGALVGASTSGGGNSGNILINSPSLELRSGSQLRASSQSSGSAGLVDLHANEILFTGAQAGAGTSRALSGIAAEATSSGNAANIRIITGNLQLTNGAQIDTSTEGGGNGGSVNINATGQTVLTGHSDTLSSGLFATTTVAATGKAGDITIKTGSLEVSDEARIELRTSSHGNGGALDITAGHIVLDGGPNATFGVRLTSETSSVASAGAISIHTGSLDVKDGAQIRTSGLTGDGGPIAITADTIHLSGAGNITLPTGVFAETAGAGKSGNITLNTGVLTATNGTLSTSSSSTAANAGNAGNIAVQGLGGQGSSATTVSLDNSTLRTTISGGNSTTPPSTIGITAQTVNLTNGSVISSDTSGAAPAGNITFNVGTLTANSLGLISSSSTGTGAGSGHAGDVVLSGVGGPGTLANSVTINQSEISTEANAGAAGSINLGSNNITLTSSLINARVNGSDNSMDTGPKADITLTGQNLLMNSSTIQADVGKFHPTAKDGGNITLNVDAFSAQGFTAENAGTISSIAGPLATGSAGKITIQGINGPGSAATSVSLDNGIFSTTISGGSAASTPATIAITANTITLSDGAQITAATSGVAPAGDITLNVGTLTVRPGMHLIEPNEGNHTGVLIASDSTSLDADAGPAGKITIQGVSGPGSAATSVSLQDSAISTKVFGGTAATTPATITVTADSVDLSNKVLADAEATFVASSQGPAPAGNIELHVNTLRGNVNPDGTPINGALTVFIDSVSNSSEKTAGPAGTVTISGLGSTATTPAKLVALDNTFISTGATGGTATTTPATITITADTVALSNGTGIFASTEGAAPAGNIAFHVNTLRTNVASDGILINDKPSVFINSSSFSADPTAGPAGTVTISGTGSAATAAAQLVALNNVNVNTTVQGGTAALAPASITITADTVALSNIAHIEASTAGPAPAGNIAFHVSTLRANVNPDGTPIRGGDQPSISSESDSSDSTAGPAGTVTISGLGPEATTAAKLVALDNTFVSTSAFGGTATTAPGAITITADTVALSNGTGFFANTFGAAPAGNIAFHVNMLRANVAPDSTPIDGAGQVSIGSASISPDSTAGPAGTVTISGLGPEATAAARLVALNNTHISPSIEGGTAATTPATVTITVDTLTLTNDAGIDSTTFGAAPAGNIAFHVNTLRANVTPEGGLINDTHNAYIVSPSFSTDSTAGPAGTVTISGLGPEATAAAKLVALNNTEVSTVISGGTAATRPATITMIADALNLTNSPNIRANTSGAAPAGNIALHVGTLTAGTSTISSTSTFADPTAGNAGTITIQGLTGSGSAATAVSLDNSTLSTTISGGSSTTPPATIGITAQTVNLTNGSQIKADTSDAAPAGNITFNVNTLTGGAIVANVGTMHLTNGANLSSRSTSTQSDAGDAGQIQVGATGTFQSDGGTVTTSAAQGKGGPITISAGNLVLTNGTLVSAENTGSKDAGNITLTSASDILMRNSTVTTSATQASGGSVKLTAPNLVRIVDSTITSSVQGQAGSNGGNINIDPQLVVIQNSQLLANANAGAGGNITIAASGAVLVDPNSLLSATAGPAGVSGSVNINAPIQVLSGALVPLKLTYSQAGLSNDRCAADPKGQFSSFVQTGRDGVPQVPGALSPSPLSFLDTLTSGSWGSQLPNLAAARLGIDSVSLDHSIMFRFHSACRS